MQATLGVGLLWSGMLVMVIKPIPCLTYAFPCASYTGLAGLMYWIRPPTASQRRCGELHREVTCSGWVYHRARRCIARFTCRPSGTHAFFVHSIHYDHPMDQFGGPFGTAPFFT